MLPIGDERVEGGGAPLVTWALVGLNVLAFFLELNQPTPDALQAFVQAWGVVPREYSAGQDLAPHIPLPFWTTLFTSMFLHGGWAHLGGNMLYLWIFGDNLEHRMGAVKFLVFYLLCGLAAGLAHIAFNSSSNVPTVGASGAISGVLGGYLLLFPKNRVRVLTRGGIAHVPAVFVLGFWIVIQLVNSFGAMARTSETGGGGVAYLAHVGGFVAGLVLVKLFARPGVPTSYTPVHQPRNW
ncbi:MAG TPA: rhomboid family intramembrane serine protease [Vicinamibacteria bacterium]|nr:rhomboid family intramembrane serine protease [Vicinamibacteria bacterium]